jgi:hypothetical protein
VSSGGAHKALGGGSSGLVHLEPAIDLVAEASTKSTDGLGLGVAGGKAFGHVRLPEARASELGDGDPV